MVDLKETLRGIAAAIVDNPDQVTVTEIEEGSNVTLVLNVAKEDMGMVIGKHGKIAKAIRTMIKVAAGSSGRRVNVEIR